MYLDLDVKDLVSGLESRVNKVLAMTVAETVQHGRKLAHSKLKSGKQNWLRGFKSHKVNDNLYVISLEGKLANWMDDGFKPGEISDSIMRGNRARHNKSEKPSKDYVDVPFFKDADAAGNIKGTNINIRAFADADAVVKDVKFSDFKSKSIKEEQRVVSRVKDIIKSVDPKRINNTTYLTIRRVTKNSNWPANPRTRKSIFNELDSFIDSKFEELLRRMI